MRIEGDRKPNYHTRRMNGYRIKGVVESSLGLHPTKGLRLASGLRACRPLLGQKGHVGR